MSRTRVTSPRARLRPWALRGGLLVAALPAMLATRALAPEGDALHGTLAALPWVVAILVAVAREAQERGGRRIPPQLVAWEIGLLAGWLALVAARQKLGLEGADEVLYAGLVLLLAAHLSAQLVALRPTLGSSVPARPSWAFVALPFAAYLVLLPWGAAHRPPDGDEPWYLLITHSLAYDLDADLTNNYAHGDSRHFLDRSLEPQPGDPKGPAGELYSRHNALLPALLAPAYRLGGRYGALLTMALLSALLAWATLRLARHEAGAAPGGALLAYALVAFAPPLLLYSYQIWVEVPAALLSVLALDAILGLRCAEPAARRRRWLLLACILLLLPLLKIRFMLLAAPLALLAWWHAGRPLRLLVALGGLLAALGGAILLFNQWLYHNPLKIHSWGEVQVQQYSLRQYWLGTSGLFFDAAFGLFACAPLWLLLLPAMLAALRARSALLLSIAVFSLPYLVVVTPRSEWYGGWSPPFRYALVALPLLALLLVPLMASRGRPSRRLLVAALGAVTLALTLLWVTVPGWTYNFADGRTYLLDHLSRRFGADLAVLFPSSVRERPATWWWPLLAGFLVPLLWWLPLGRRRHLGRWGVVMTLVGLALLPSLALALPTRRVELEDPYVLKAGGHLYPDPWVIERSRYRGSWVLREGEGLSVPVRPGGRWAHFYLDTFLVRHHPGPAALEVLAGSRSLATVRLTNPRQWRRLDLGAHAWPAGEPLVIRFVSSNDPGQPNGVLLDRLELVWGLGG